MNKKANAAEILASFFLNDSEFALPVKCVQEVVNPPEKLTTLPLTPKYLLGVFNLRGTVIPVVDLKVLMKIPENDSSMATKKIGIVDYQGVKIGLPFDRTGEVFRYNAGEKSAFNYEESSAKEGVISGVIKLEEGKRLIQLLDVFALIKLDNVPRSSLEDESGGSVQQKKKHQGTRKQCISFVIGQNCCAFNIDSIHEIIKVPQLKKSTLLSGCCIGMFDLRGDIVPVVDFAALLKYRDLETEPALSEDHRIIILRKDSTKIGLLVESVESIVTYYTEEILNVPNLNQGTASIITGCLPCESGKDVLILSSAELLANAGINEILAGHHKIYNSAATASKEEQKRKGPKKTYITFKIENLLALGIEEVKEIIEFPREMLKPPGLPAYVKGMLNLRGQIVAVLDIRSLYEKAEQTDTASAKVLIFEKNGVNYGMIVDSVENITSFSEDEKIKIPALLYKDEGSNGIRDDVKFAVEIQVGEEKKTLLILDLNPLIDKAGFAPAQQQSA